MIYPPAANPYPAAPPPVSAPPSPRPARRWFAAAFGLIAVLLTAGAVVLAALAPQLSQSNADVPPAGWSQVYDSNLRTADDMWDVTKGCGFTQDGLHAGPGATCAFMPAGNPDLANNGFLLQITIAPSGSVQSEELPIIVVGTAANISIDPMGQYAICSTSPCSLGSALDIQGATAAWHSDSFVENVVSVKYFPNTATLTVYVNGRQIASAAVSPGALSPLALALATTSSAEALYTHATLYTGSGSGG